MNNIDIILEIFEKLSYHEVYEMRTVSKAFKEAWDVYKNIEHVTCKEFDNNKTIWYINGRPGRPNDLPAVIYSNGTKIWYLNGQRHRANDLPAIIFANGTQAWYLHGTYNRSNI